MNNIFPPQPNYIWYVAYGSNLCEERFMMYINGGTYKISGVDKTYDGCTDKTPPIVSKPFFIPYDIYFAKKSKTWGDCGVAFLDTTKDGNSLGRAYLIKEEQFHEINKQEGSKWYNTIIDLTPRNNSIAHKTFTGNWLNELNNPNQHYLKIILKGLVETYAIKPIT